MIYFLDNSLQLQKIVTSKNVISAIHEHELNGLIRADVELDLSYANKFLVLGIDHVGYYYKDEFYLHKIQRVEYDHVNETATVVLRHIFFEDMIFGKLIRDVRPQNQDALTVSRQTIDANTRWQTIMTDVTGRLSTNFYWQVPYEVIEFMTENYRVEYLPKILFDGKKINGFQLHLANKIGEDKNIRIPYGSRVLDLKYDEDYSEIITKLVVHGKGEEVGDGYGRRINISDVNFSRNGVESPVGSLYLEDESITNTYGNDGQTPREGREIFEDIEDANELAEAGYQHYLQVSRPQMLFTADVSDIGDVGIGDSVMIIRREYDVYFNARIHKLSVDLLYPEDAKVELGDYKHFKESKVARKTREKNNRVQGQLSDRITRLKKEANDFIDGEFSQAISEFEQNLIDQKAQIEADRENMTNLINTKTEEFNTSFAAGMAEAELKRQENYNAMSDYVNTTVDTTRSDLESNIASSIAETERKAQLEYKGIEQRVTDKVDTTRTELENTINTSIDDAKLYAEQQAQAKSDAVKTELETVTNGHQQMLDVLESSVMNIDDFIGDSRSVTLDERFQDITMNFEERIRNIDSTHYNIVRGTSFDNPDLMLNHGQTEIITNETDNFARLGLGTTALPYLMLREYFNVEAGETYKLIFTYRTADVPEIDFIRLRPPGGSTGSYGGDLIIEDNMTESEKATTLTNQWTKKTVSFVVDRDMPVRLMIGTNFDAGNTQRGILDIKKPYLTTTNNREWLPHPDDNTQNVSEIVRRVTLLEDGRSELITRSEYDFETGELDQYIKSVEETVEGNKTVLQRVEDWQTTNGASIEETIYGFDQKVWLNDIANIGANLIPQSANAWENGGLWIEGGGVSGNLQNIRTKERIAVQPNTTYTLSSNSAYISAIERVDIHQYLTTGGWINRRTIPRNGEVTFTTWGTAGTVRISLVAREGFSINPNFIDHPDGRVKIKLEVGDTATPMLNAISRIEQLANSVSIQVQELDGDFLSQSDIQVKAGYVQLGSQRLGDSQLASILQVSPNSIQAITDRMILNGDLYVDGDITALAVDAIEGNFARLFASQVEANTISVDYISGRTAWFERLYTLNANIERLTSQIVFTDAINAKVGNFIDLNVGTIRSSILTANTIETSMLKANVVTSAKIKVDDVLVNRIISQSVYANDVTSKIGNFIDLNAGNIVTAGLSADVIKSDHIQVGTGLIDKMFATSARIDQLITKTHFVNEMHALTLNVVELNASQIRTRLLSANTIEASWIKSGTALLDRVFSSTAMFERMMAKSGFVTTLNTVTIDTDQLTIRRPDGVAWVSNGMARHDYNVQMTEFLEGSNISWNGQWYETSSSSRQRCQLGSFKHVGRTLRAELNVRLSGYSPSQSEWMYYSIESFGSGLSFSRQGRILVRRTEVESFPFEIDLGRPSFSNATFYIRFWRDSAGAHADNIVQLRCNRVSIED